MARSLDGKMWFQGLGGASVIDPQHLPSNEITPPVHIERITANGKTYDASNGIRLPPRIRDLKIDYTALSFVAPETVQFRYQLEGQDRNWREVTNDREAQYSNLPPGDYVFRVTAANKSGVWNEASATLEFSVAPAWFQTDWFYASCVLAGLLIAWTIYGIRMRQVARSLSARFDERLSERTRIARDLHDTLLQSFQASLIQMQRARNHLSRSPEEAIRTLDNAIGSTEQAIVEGRDAIQDLRLTVTPQRDLEHLLTVAGRELAKAQDANGTPPMFRVTVEGPHRSLSPILQDEVYRIGREVLRNAFRHSQASHIEAEIRYDKRKLRLRIRDDGKGIDQKIMAEGARAGHWGLPGARERATRIGARLDFWSEAGAGTEVELTVPASMAYAKPQAQRRFGFFRKKRRSVSNSGLIRILTADDHALLRNGIAGLVNDEPDMKMVAEAATGVEAIKQFKQYHPDITLMDLQMPEMSGIEAIIEIRSEFPEARIIVLTTYTGDVQVTRALKAGVRGYLLKARVNRELVDVIRAVYSGQKRIPPEIAAELAEHAGEEDLSARELEVLGLIARGNANKEIAARLAITEETVKSHVRRILDKLSANDRTHAVTIALKRGIIDF